MTKARFCASFIFATSFRATVSQLPLNRHAYAESRAAEHVFELPALVLDDDAREQSSTPRHRASLSDRRRERREGRDAHGAVELLLADAPLARHRWLPGARTSAQELVTELSSAAASCAFGYPDGAARSHTRTP